MNNRGVILNVGNGAWAFSDYAKHLARNLWLEISETPAELNYVLWFDNDKLESSINSFIPISAINVASDKRHIAKIFRENNVSTPETILIDTIGELMNFVQENSDKEWCLKWPVGCGAIGHQLLNNDVEISANYPKPFVVQEFVRMEQPKVYRTYCVAGEIFGWNVRKYANREKGSPWVSHANGARYDVSGHIPDEARLLAINALKATNLYTSFGCVDLILHNGWKALEVGTDGIYNYIDRDFNSPHLENAINSQPKMD